MIVITKHFNTTERYWFRKGINRVWDAMMFIGDPEFDERPTWQKVLIYVFVTMLPFIGSIDDINFSYFGF